MSVGLVAIHYPLPEHRDELVQRVRRAAEIMREVPGCLSVGTWTNAADDSIATTGEWESEAALTESFAAVRAAGVDFDYDDREAQPREVIRLVSPA
jgi:quinol monooxygenase YgiN